MRQFLSKTFFVLGFACLIASGFLIWERNTPRRLEFTGQEIGTSTQTSANLPQMLAIDDLDIALPIIEARYDTQKWDTTPYGVSYLNTSPSPGEIGNSILYGHNWPNLLGSLTKAKPGQIVEITFTDKSKKKFKITYIQEVTPDQSHILSQTTDRRITLYTCSGFLDRKRFVVVAVETNEIALSSL